MTCRIVALAAASTLTLSVALAQSPTPSVGAAENTHATAHSAKVIDQQKPDEWLASKFKGTDVLGADGTKVGSVDDVLFDRSGQIKAIVVGVGGFRPGRVDDDPGRHPDTVRRLPRVVAGHERDVVPVPA